MDLLKVSHLSLVLNRRRILKDLSFKLAAGRVYALAGPNGAGKSSLVYTLMGLEGYRPARGQIFFRGQEITSLSVSRRAKLGITLGWQEPARFEGLKVGEYLDVSAPSLVDDPEEFLKMVGLKPAYLNRAVDATLSGGERKRIELASIAAMRPALALLDEPDSGIDADSLGVIFQTIRWLAKKGTTVFFITHSSTVLRQADEAFLLCHGQLQSQNKTGGVYQFFHRHCLNCSRPNRPQK